MRHHSVYRVAIAAIMLFTSTAYAQDATETLVPNKIIKLEAKFSGPDANKITMIYATLSTQAQPAVDQAGFQSSIAANAPPISPGLFHLEFTIPETVVSGDYSLSLDVRGPDGIRLFYSDGQQFHFHTFHIVTHGKFTQPSVTIKEVH